ncbi:MULTISPECIES: hypothetical protein [Vibrio]|uniref:hypothetical protein n=1 Tax=Vibrio TaxID=662 RepID=UPI001551B64C|nr:hypothetical protein [Vibrio sp. PID17_43]
MIISTIMVMPWLGYAKKQAISASMDDEDIEWGSCPPFFPDECLIAVLHGEPGKTNADI